MPDYTATDFYKDELSRLQAKQQNTDIILNSQERLALLNDSYRKRYARYVQILMVLVVAALVYLGVVLLQKQFPAIPQVVVDAVSIILIFLVVFYLFSVFSELSSRSLLNYDELDLPAYDASGMDISDLAEKGQIFDSQATKGNVCVGSACCPGLGEYDTTTNRCLTTGGTNATTPAPTTAPGSGTNFTTLEYEKIESAYKDVTFDSPTLKREPTANNVEPLHHVTVLSFSTFN
jgi:hypothetical protein